MNEPMVTMWESDQPCERCGALMVTDGRTLTCPACKHKQPFPPIKVRESLHRKKWAYRTSRNIREDIDE